MIEQIFNQITSNPLLMVIVAIIVILLVFSVLKKLFKLALMLVADAIVIFGYVYLTSDNPQQDIQKLIDQGKQGVEQIKDKAKEVGGDLKEKVDKLKEADK